MALHETCLRGLCVVRPAAASFSEVHAPAASLGRRSTPPLGDGLAATVSPQAQFERCGQPFRRSLGLAPCPALSGAPCAAHALPPRPAADRFALLRGLCLGRSAITALRRGSCRSPRPATAHYARRSALGGSVPLYVGIRSGRVRVLRFAPVPGVRSRGFAPAPVRPPPCAGAGSCPRPCRLPGSASLRRAPNANRICRSTHPLYCIEYVLNVKPLNL